jgi:hypothetical protein
MGLDIETTLELCRRADEARGQPRAMVLGPVVVMR